MLGGGLLPIEFAGSDVEDRRAGCAALEVNQRLPKRFPSSSASSEELPGSVVTAERRLQHADREGGERDEGIVVLRDPVVGGGGRVEGSVEVVEDGRLHETAS